MHNRLQITAPTKHTLCISDGFASFGISRHAWTGGKSPTQKHNESRLFVALRKYFFRESVAECGGSPQVTDYRILFDRARFDAYATMRGNGFYNAAKHDNGEE